MTNFRFDTVRFTAVVQQDEEQERESRHHLFSILNGAVRIDTAGGDLDQLHVTSGGTASSTSVDSGCWYYVTPDTASDLTPLLRDGTEEPAGQTVIDECYIRDDRVTVYENEVYRYAWVDQRGRFYITSGGTALHTTVNTYGPTYEEWGGMHVFEGGTAEDTTVGGLFAFLHVSSGGAANGVTVNADGRADVSAGGIMNGVQVKEGGWFYVFSGGIASDVTVDTDACGAIIESSGVMKDITASAFGNLHISSGGTATGRISIENRAVSAFPGAVIDYDLSGIAPGTAARISGLSRVSGWEDATYTLTVSGTQPDGTYTLAENADEFCKPLMVRSETGVILGTLAVGSVLLMDDCTYSLTLDQSNVLTMTKENRSGVLNTELIADGHPLGIGSGQYTQNVIGGTSVEASGDPAEFSGNTSLVIDGGEFSRNLFCGDRVLSGSMERTGDINTTINGGTFSGYVVGGLCFNQKINSKRAELNGNVCLTITGGTFNGKGIYGGCIAANQNSSAMTKINGNVSTVFHPDTDSIITIKGHVYAGSYRLGKITGNVSVVFSGAGTVNIGGEIWGGCSGDYYIVSDGGNRTFISSINEDSKRLLSFSGFTGGLTCQKIRGFESIEFVRDDGIATHASLSGSGYNLSDIRNWTFEYGCNAQNSDFANDFTGDTLMLTGLPDEEAFMDWTILTNSRDGAFIGFGDELTVYLGTRKMSWNSTQSCFLSDGYRLALDETSSPVSMILSKLA